MWADVEDQLQDVLCARLYPAIETDRRYARFLVKAGIAAGAPRDWTRLSHQAQSRLDQQARVESHAVVSAVAASGLLTGTGCQATTIVGPTRLCRLGEIWFPEEVLQRCDQEAGAEGRVRWLRTFLNIPGDEQQLFGLYLPGGAEIPAIQDLASPLRRFSRTSWRHPKLPNYKYWAGVEESFAYGVARAVLPFIPDGRVQKMEP